MSDNNVRRFYNEAAKEDPNAVRDYGTFQQTMALYQALKSIHDEKEALKFLDICCGVGRVSASLRQAYTESEFVGFDLAPIPLDIAVRQKRIDIGEEINLATPNTPELEPYREKFDVAFCIAASGFFSPTQMPTMLQNAANCLKPRGNLFIHHALITPEQPPFKERKRMRIYGATLPNLRTAYAESGLKITMVDVMNPSCDKPDKERTGKILLHARKNG
jgi:ubiquinone/menaquinone biosynthesis C-methylase UbiE